MTVTSEHSRWYESNVLVLLVLWE